MHYVDVIFAVVLCGFALYGFKLGALKGTAALVALVVGLVFATKSMHVLGDSFSLMLNVHAALGSILAFVIIFFGVILVQIVLVRILWRPSKPAGLLSRLIGAGLGIVEGSIYISLLLVLLNLYNKPSKHVREKSVTYSSLLKFAPQVFDAAQSIFSYSTTFHEELKKSLEKRRPTPLD